MKNLAGFVESYQEHLKACEDPDYLLKYKKRLPRFPGSDELHKEAAERTARYVKGYKLILKIMTGNNPLAHMPSHCATTGTGTRIDWDAVPEDEARIGATVQPYAPGDGGILCMPLLVNIPDPKSPSWEITACPAKSWSGIMTLSRYARSAH